MYEYRNPKWWTTEDDIVWERTKASLKRDWNQTQPATGTTERATDELAYARACPTASLPDSKPHYRILVVEDDPDIRCLNTEVLIHYGYTVDAAEDGALAYEALSSQCYDLMVTDNSMPKMTGVELLRKLHDTGMALPTIMATSHVPKGEFQKQPWLTPAAALIKPYTLSDLVEKVREVLSQTGGNDERTISSNN